MPELEQLRAGHAPAVLAFELVNRAYFAASVSDRGDEFFGRFPDRYSALLAEQEAGLCAFYALVAERQDAKTGQKEIFGVGRLSKARGLNEAEFALLISDQWQKQGLGTELLQRLVQIGRDEKLARIFETSS